MLGKNSPDRPLRALVIGAGGMAQHTHLPLLAKHRDAGEIVLSLICDLLPDRSGAAKRRFGFLEETADAVAALERPDIDVVYIFGTAQMHHEYGLLALGSGKNLFVEKPIAPSFAAALELAAMARERSVIAAGGHNRRFFPALAAAQAEAGKAGWRFMEAVFHKAEFGRAPPFGAKSWLTANGIHALDVLVYMAGGLPDRMASFAESAGSAEPRNFSAIMRWRDGCQATFSSDNSAGSRKEDYVFHGIERTCIASAERLRIETPGGVREIAYGLVGNGFAAEHLAFLEALRDSAEPKHSIAALAPTLFLAELIERGFTGTIAQAFEQQPMDVPRASSARHAHVPHAHVVGAARDRAILVIKPDGLHDVLPHLAARYRIVSLDNVNASAKPRSDVVAVIIGQRGGPIPDGVLAKLPNVAIVGICGLSLGYYGPEALFARNIPIVNANESYARTVAEFALGLALLGRRRAFLSHNLMRRGGWGTIPYRPGFKGLLVRAVDASRPLIGKTALAPVMKKLWSATKTALHLPGIGQEGPYSLHDFSGLDIGLVGWSANARAFVELLRPFNAAVKVFSEHATDEELSQAGARRASLDEVLKAAIVSLHRGLTPQTRHCLGAAELALLRPGTVLVNVARGGLIDEGALVARLRRNDIFACLDTYDREPLPPRHPLRRLPNVFLTSHIAGGTIEMHKAAAREVAGKVMEYLDGKEVKTISREQWQTMT